MVKVALAFIGTAAATSCSSADQKAILAMDDNAFGDQANMCATAALALFGINLDKFIPCMATNFGISTACAACYVVTADDGFWDCKSVSPPQCKIGWSKATRLPACTGIPVGTPSLEATNVAISSGFLDCDAATPSQHGPYKTSLAQDFTHEGHSIYLRYPTDALPSSASAWPVVVMMHAPSLGFEWYEKHVEHWASHGFVVAFPFIKSPSRDNEIIPVLEYDGSTVIAAVHFLESLANGSIASPQNLVGGVDASNMALLGHNLGASEVIRVGASMQKPENLKLVFAQHPNQCDRSSYETSAEIQSASQHAPFFMSTSENDDNYMYKCWQKATGTAGFANFKKEVCAQYPPCKSISAENCLNKVGVVGSGVMCSTNAPGVETWTSPELKWITTTLKLYLHNSGNAGSACGAMMWGSADTSFRKDPNMATTEIHGPRGLMV